MADIHRGNLVWAVALISFLSVCSGALATDYGKLPTYYIIPVEVTVPATTISGGGGGGGGWSAVENIPSIAIINPGESVSVKPDNPVAGISELIIQALNLMTDVRTTIQEVAKPTFAPDVTPSQEGMTYKYVEIKTSARTDDVARIVIKFRVERSWFVLNFLDSNTVRLARLENGGWQNLATSKVGQDTTYFYYESETAGFSTFAIFAKKKTGDVLDFAYLPVLKEIEHSQVNTFSVSVKNNAYTSINGVSVKLAGVPRTWVYVEPYEADIGSDGIKEYNITITVPSSATPGRYEAVLSAGNDDISTDKMFILRIKPYSEEPVVTRAVSIDKMNEQTNVEIFVSNPSNSSINVQIMEKIDKELAQNVKDIDFDTNPTEIIEPDPVVSWDIINLGSNEKRVIEYSTSNVLEDFTAYLAWPFQQIQIYSQRVPRGFKLSNYMISDLTPGRSSKITFTVENLETVSHNLQVRVEPPYNWVVDPKIAEDVIAAKSKSEFDFDVFVPADAQDGRYIVRAIFYWDGDMVIREFAATVGGYQKLIYLAIAATILVAASVAVYFYRSRRGEHLYSWERKKY